MQIPVHDFDPSITHLRMRKKSPFPRLFDICKDHYNEFLQRLDDYTNSLSVYWKFKASPAPDNSRLSNLRILTVIFPDRCSIDFKEYDDVYPIFKSIGGPYPNLRTLHLKRIPYSIQMLETSSFALTQLGGLSTLRLNFLNCRDPSLKDRDEKASVVVGHFATSLLNLKVLTVFEFSLVSRGALLSHIFDALSKMPQVCDITIGYILVLHYLTSFLPVLTAGRHRIRRLQFDHVEYLDVQLLWDEICQLEALESLALKHCEIRKESLLRLFGTSWPSPIEISLNGIKVTEEKDIVVNSLLHNVVGLCLDFTNKTTFISQILKHIPHNTLTSFSCSVSTVDTYTELIPFLRKIKSLKSLELVNQIAISRYLNIFEQILLFSTISSSTVTHLKLVNFPGSIALHSNGTRSSTYCALISNNSNLKEINLESLGKDFEFALLLQELQLLQNARRMQLQLTIEGCSLEYLSKTDLKCKLRLVEKETTFDFHCVIRILNSVLEMWESSNFVIDRVVVEDISAEAMDQLVLGDGVGLVVEEGELCLWRNYEIFKSIH
ncbi:hypothetical protein HK098_002940 [Nowakowskiella sp. JEL0407]|nr:hypothetical protein HK098_002940 [Nowakowskiella sp. JEL0407]